VIKDHTKISSLCRAKFSPTAFTSRHIGLGLDEKYSCTKPKRLTHQITVCCCTDRYFTVTLQWFEVFK